MNGRNHIWSYRETSIRFSTWIKSDFSDFGSFGLSGFWCIKKVKKLSWKGFTATKKFLIETLLEEVDQVVIQKWSKWEWIFFETNDILYSITGPSGFWHTRENQRFFLGIPLYDLAYFDRDLDKGLNHCIIGEKWAASSWNSKTFCAFCRFVNVRIPNDMFHHISFRNIFVFFSRKDYDSEKNIPKKLKKRSVTYFLSLEILTDLWISIFFFNFFRLLKKNLVRNYLVQLSRKADIFWAKKPSY